MQESPETGIQVRPGFAVLVFGSGAVLVALALIHEAELPYARLCLFAWFLSLVFLSLRGFWNEAKDAFAPVDQQFVNSVVALLFVVGAGALILEGPGPGAGLIILAFLWAFASKYWSFKFQRASSKLGIDPTEPIQMVSAFVQLIIVAVAIVLIVIHAIFF